MAKKTDVGGSEYVDDRVVLKWIGLAWKSAVKDVFSIKDLLIVVNLILTVVCIIVSFLRV